MKMTELSYEYFMFASLAILGLVEWMKSLDPKNKLKNFYAYFPAILSIPFGFMLIQLHGMPFYTLPLFSGSILAFSVLGYTSGVRLIQKFMNSESKEFSDMLDSED